MKPDLSWPPPPKPHVSPHKQLPFSLTPARARAVLRLGTLATIAESKIVPDAAPLPDDSAIRSPEDLVLACVSEFFATLSASGVEVALALPDLASLRVVESPQGEGQPPKLRPLNGRLFALWAQQLGEDHANVLLIDVKQRWGISGLGPQRGDIAVFGDGHIAIVTAPLCKGCQHFESVEFTPRDKPEEAPTIRKVTHWTSTLTHLVRLVFEAESGKEKQEEEKQKAESGEQKSDG